MTSQCRYDRRALPVAKGKFGNWAVGKLTNLLMRNAWKIVDEPLTSVQRVKLEAAATVSVTTIQCHTVFKLLNMSESMLLLC